MSTPVISILYNNQINARALIGRSAMVYCVGKLMEKLYLPNYYIKAVNHKFPFGPWRRRERIQFV